MVTSAADDAAKAKGAETGKCRSWNDVIVVILAIIVPLVFNWCLSIVIDDLVVILVLNGLFFLVLFYFWSKWAKEKNAVEDQGGAEHDDETAALKTLLLTLPMAELQHQALAAGITAGGVRANLAPALAEALAKGNR